MKRTNTTIAYFHCDTASYFTRLQPVAAWCLQFCWEILLKQVWVQSRQLGCQHDMHSPHLLLNAVLRRRCCWVTALAAVERYVPPAGRSAANPPHAAAAVEWWDRQTDRRTPDRYTDPVLHTMRAVSISRQTIRYWRTVPESIHGRQLSNEMTVDESNSLSWQSKMRKQTKHVIDHRRPHNQSLI